MFTPILKSNYGQALKKHVAVVGMDTFKGIKVIYSSNFLFLKNHFDLLETPLILHAALHKHTKCLKTEIDGQLQLRSDIKKKLQNSLLSTEECLVLESSSSRAKLQVNSSYGFTLLKQGKTI